MTEKRLVIMTSARFVCVGMEFLCTHSIYANSFLDAATRANPTTAGAKAPTRRYSEIELIDDINLLPVPSITRVNKTTQNAGNNEKAPQVTASIKCLLNIDIVPAMQPKANARILGPPRYNLEESGSDAPNTNTPNRGQIAQATAKKRHIRAVTIIRIPPAVGILFLTGATLLEDTQFCIKHARAIYR